MKYSVIPILCFAWACEPVDAKIESLDVSLTPTDDETNGNNSQDDNNDSGNSNSNGNNGSNGGNNGNPGTDGDNNSGNQQEDLEDLIDDLEEDCNNNDPEACAELEFIEEMVEECEDGNQDACDKIDAILSWDDEEEEDSYEDLDQLLDELGEACEDGNQYACEQLSFLEQIEEDCENGDEAACDKIDYFLGLTDDEEKEDWAGWESENYDEVPWETGEYDAILEFYRISPNQGPGQGPVAEVEIEQVCSETFTVTIANNGDIFSEGACQIQTPNGQSELEFMFDGQQVNTSANGVVEITRPNGNVVDTNFIGYSYEENGSYSFSLQWEITINLGPTQVEHFGELFYD